MPPSDPSLPAREEATQVLWVHSLLDEEVDLPPHTEHRPLLHTLQLLLEPEQDTFGNLVEALSVATGKKDKASQWFMQSPWLFAES